VAISQLKSTKTPSKEGNNLLVEPVKAVISTESVLDLDTSENFSEQGKKEYEQLQLRIFRMTLAVTVFSVATFFIFVGFQAAISLLIGAFSGILYLRLLARGIGKLGSSTSVSKIQLLIPVLLVIAASRLPQLELLPALLGFVLYKPSLIVQFLLER
tara:strand:+ start:40344 stop:40814 length:471 start_codon:yes stop_codon:yes gene_type:complete